MHRLWVRTRVLGLSRLFDLPGTYSSARLVPG
jgi:hypothetical protein